MVKTRQFMRIEVSCSRHGLFAGEVNVGDVLKKFGEIFPGAVWKNPAPAGGRSGIAVSGQKRKPSVSPPPKSELPPPAVA